MKDRTLVFVSNGEEDTMKAGRILAGITKGVITLEGDLGTGKTVFARGIAAGLGIDEYITSPTFNIINVYEKEGIVFNHMDAYRITDPDMLYDIGFDEIVDEGDVTVIEWADMISEEILSPALNVRIRYGSEKDCRIIYIEGPKTLVEEFTRGLE